ncbi:hypothetical protein BJ138DRAFT_1057343 [Hygrophoropsis aurantiaca]|uniref:Uncharacterized protein n=1 Tax=Hygrophoropsis aurantiaca TaxID=72124 RepID=A0ACB8AM78_9AGAM|nr:hypothetical protein BJ138DRAFT_1057343 [Hygrophoropsis aurantiaca]
MGRAAKVCKRVKKAALLTPNQNTSKTTMHQPKQSSSANDAISAAQAAKKRTDLKEKAKSRATVRRGQHKDAGRVLGGADYVTLLMGSRKKAAAEGLKLPQEPDS